MSEQTGFFFDAPLEHIPVSQLPPSVAPPAAAPVVALPPTDDKAAFEAQARAVLHLLPDDFELEDVLDLLNIPRVGRIGWHRARILSVLCHPDNGFKGYTVGAIPRKHSDPPCNFRYKRKLPLEPCPGLGLDDVPRTNATEGGVRCWKCKAREAANEEDR